MIAAYTYDGAGNISSSYLQGGLVMDAPVNCKFNELNQMTEYTDPNVVKTTYTYYPNGLRKTKTTEEKTTTYYYDGDNAIIEAENGSLKYRNIYGMNQIARQDAAGNPYYFLYNGHGDAVKLVDSAGNIKNSYTYDIYGKVTNAVENGIPNPMRYAGQMYDNESGLYYLRARYYDPRVGRFISEDTEKGDINNPSSLNLYTYCWGNPLNYYDPSGYYPSPSADMLKLGMGIAFAVESIKIQSQYWINRAGEYIVNAGNIMTMSTDKVAAAKDTVNAAKDKYSNGSSSNSHDPNKWDKIGNKIAQIGDRIGNYGKLIEHPGQTVNWSKTSLHALDSMGDRNITKQMVETWTNNGKAIWQGGTKTYLYLTREGAVVLGKDGILVTTWSKAEFRQYTIDAIKLLYGN